MTSEDKGLFPPDALRDKHDAFILALSAFDSNLGSHLGDTTRWTRFFKVLLRRDGSWLAILGSLDEDQEPIVAFGNGGSLLKAMTNLGRTIAAGDWREDRYANEE